MKRIKRSHERHKDAENKGWKNCKEKDKQTLEERKRETEALFLSKAAGV